MKEWPLCVILGSMVNLSNVPPVTIEYGTWGTVEISKRRESSYLLKNMGVEWNIYNPKHMREYCEQWSGYDLAYGDVLLTGFGFGQMATWVASKPGVEKVTVIEISQDVVDAFLSNNSLPNNVEVIIDDANNFKTNKKYDCVIFDHISNFFKEKSFYEDLCKMTKNIPHDIFWFWSLEAYYLIHHYGITLEQLHNYPIDFKPFDFSLKWQELRETLNISTIPNLEKNKIDEYINSYFLRHLIQE